MCFREITLVFVGSMHQQNETSRRTDTQRRQAWSNHGEHPTNKWELAQKHNTSVFLTFLFFFIYFYQLEANYFTIFQWFLPYIDMNQPWIYMCSPSQSPLPPPSPCHPSGSSQCTSPEHLSHASNLGWWSVSPLIVYLFQCCSLRTSHPRLLPQSPKVCSVCLCLFFCFAYWVFITIF